MLKKGRRRPPCVTGDDEPVMASLDGYRTLLSWLVIIDLESNEGMDCNLRIRENVARGMVAAI